MHDDKYCHAADGDAADDATNADGDASADDDDEDVKDDDEDAGADAGADAVGGTDVDAAAELEERPGKSEVSGAK